MKKGTKKTAAKRKRPSTWKASKRSSMKFPPLPTHATHTRWLLYVEQDYVRKYATGISIQHNGSNGINGGLLGESASIVIGPDSWSKERRHAVLLSREDAEHLQKGIWGSSIEELTIVTEIHR